MGLAWLAAGQAYADPAPLRPIVPPSPVADFRDPPPLMPVIKGTLPEFAPPPAVKPTAPAKTLYYQKDANKAPLAPPAPGMTVLPLNYQDPAVGQPPSLVPQLPAKSVVTTAPSIANIPVQSDAELQRTIIKETNEEYKQQDSIFKRFPDDYTPITTQPYTQRMFSPAALRVEPTYTCFNRLYFEDKNTERYGWELGPLQPFVSAGKFYGDLLFYPYHFGTRPCQRFETSAGECLPGDPVPYLIYPVELSLTGAILEAGTAVGLAAIYP